MNYDYIDDLNYGVAVLNSAGVVTNLNQKGKTILGEPGTADSLRYYQLFHIADSRNDAFNQILLDAIQSHKTTAHSIVPFYASDGSESILDVSISIIRGEEVFLSFTDVTELEKVKKREHDASVIFVLLLLQTCIWIFLTAINEWLGQPIDFVSMCYVLYGYCAVFFVVLSRSVKIDWHSGGLSFQNFRKHLVTDTVLTLIITAGMLLLKYILCRMGYYADGPFLDWSRFTRNEVFYAGEVVIQEFLARVIVHENLRKIIRTKHSEALALLVSSVFFGAIHIHGGIVYMFGAMLLMGFFGLIYRKQNSIWALCIPHYVLGVLLVLLRLV